jgi:hypothetical protein
MTKLLDDAIAAVRTLPPETQDDIGRYLLQLIDAPPLSPDEIAALDEAEGQLLRGEIISGPQLDAFWKSLEA